MFSFLVLPFFIILLLIIAPLIYLNDKGAVFYNAPRLGKNGKVFIMYKFRSMKMGAPDIRNDDGSTFNSKNDNRLTRIGRFLRKTSIDETPQIFNILKGDMSFIGPRPDLPSAIDILTAEEKVKLTVRPGITGYSQAYFRNDVSLKARFKQDIFYIDNLSFFLDLKIFLITIKTVFFGKGVFRNH